MPSLKHVTGSKQLQFLPPLLYFDKFFVLPPSLKHMSERQWGYIYRPVPPLSTLAPSLLPAPSLPQHIYAVGRKYSCWKDLFLSGKYVLVGRIYSCRKDISLHNITSGFSPLIQIFIKISFFRLQYEKSLFIFLSFFPLCSITDLSLGKTEQSCL